MASTCSRRTPHAHERRRKTARGGGKIARVGREARDCAQERQRLRALERGNPACVGKAGFAHAGEGKSRPRLHICHAPGSRMPGSRGKLRSLAGEGREERGEEKRATGASTWEPPAPSAQLHPSPPQSPPDPPASSSVTDSVRAFPSRPPIVCSSSLPLFCLSFLCSDVWVVASVMHSTLSFLCSFYSDLLVTCYSASPYSALMMLSC